MANTSLKTKKLDVKTAQGLSMQNSCFTNLLNSRLICKECIVDGNINEQRPNE